MRKAIATIGLALLLPLGALAETRSDLTVTVEIDPHSGGIDVAMTGSARCGPRMRDASG